MALVHLARRAIGRYQRIAATRLFQRPFSIASPVPVISFTFDDFPKSALFTGGAILRQFGAGGTYYASLGLAGKEIETGQMFALADIEKVLEDGHELGSHTFDHCHSWDTDPVAFGRSIAANDSALRALSPQARFKTFSYPISPPRPMTKRSTSGHFQCCRGGGQTFNRGTIDLGYLSAYFLEQDRERPEAAKAMIDKNRDACGWLIFATHDVSKNPTAYGCTPEFFESIVRYASDSGAQILPVAEALEILRAPSVAEQHRQCGKPASLMEW
jgi:peptidoglycan/xylan/chitin deacetylase (PgdA/CDA1 family)